MLLFAGGAGRTGATIFCRAATKAAAALRVAETVVGATGCCPLIGAATAGAALDDPALAAGAVFITLALAKVALTGPAWAGLALAGLALAGLALAGLALAGLALAGLALAELALAELALTGLGLTELVLAGLGRVSFAAAFAPALLADALLADPSLSVALPFLDVPLAAAGVIGARPASRAPFAVAASRAFAAVRGFAEEAAAAGLAGLRTAADFVTEGFAAVAADLLFVPLAETGFAAAVLTATVLAADMAAHSSLARFGDEPGGEPSDDAPLEG